MPAAVTAIIPTLDEEPRIGATIAAARAAGVSEVIVSDGGSSDGTVSIAGQYGARVLTGATMRAAQLNQGIAAASHDLLVFLHADTLLPSNGASAVAAALESGAVFGGFRLAFIEHSFRLRVAAALINARTAVTHCPWGDQAQFVRRQTLQSHGAFVEIPLMEDYELAVRMKGLGRTVVLPQTVRTSGRRFLARGVFLTAVTNWRIVAAYRAGADPAALARLYRR